MPIKISRNYRLDKLTEPTARGSANDTRDASPVLSPSVGQCRGDVTTRKRFKQVFVPVVDSQQKPLMPTKPSRARRWIRDRKATGFFKRGIFCVRLNVDPSDVEVQEIACGIDPGSKMEGISVKAATKDYLNIQAEATTWVKDAVEVRRNMRRTRRNRKTPCRQNRINRSRGCLPPAIKARWQWKLRLAMWLGKMYPITHFVVEDIQAKTLKGKRRWNNSFSPLEVGKKYFYAELEKIAPTTLKQGYETKEIRDSLCLKKSKNKITVDFSAHAVDSWCLAHSWVGGNLKPTNTDVLAIVPLRFHRRQLHVLQPAKGGVRKPYGSTLSLGLKRGSLVKHPKHGLTYVGGNAKGRVSLHQLTDGKRLCTNAKVEDIKFLTFNTWRIGNSSPGLKSGVSLPKRS